MTVHIEKKINLSIIYKIMFVVISAILCFIMQKTVFAESLYYNEENGYEVVIEDDADLLSDYEEEKLLSKMIKITEYGSVAFKSISDNSVSTESYIRSYYREVFGTKSGTVFLIDMDNRNIWIYSYGDVYDIVTTNYANIITDNIYEYASDAEYYDCAYKAFSQILTLLEGNDIAQPMKYISNILLALVLSFLINYFIVKKVSSAKKASDKQLLRYINHQYQFDNARAEFTHTTKKYSPKSSSSSGGGGGGGSRGGGGGHSF